MNAPDPGEGWRLVTLYKEVPHPMAEVWLPEKGKWETRLAGLVMSPYCWNSYYRVPIDTPAVPPIPTSEDPLPFFNEPSSSAAVVVWIVAALAFVTGVFVRVVFVGIWAMENVNAYEAHTVECGNCCEVMLIRDPVRKGDMVICPHCGETSCIESIVGAWRVGGTLETHQGETL